MGIYVCDNGTYHNHKDYRGNPGHVNYLPTVAGNRGCLEGVFGAATLKLN